MWNEQLRDEKCFMREEHKSKISGKLELWENNEDLCRLGTKEMIIVV
jgi:hypothetical protein